MQCSIQKFTDLRQNNIRKNCQTLTRSISSSGQLWGLGKMILDAHSWENELRAILSRDIHNSKESIPSSNGLVVFFGKLLKSWAYLTVNSTMRVTPLSGTKRIQKRTKLCQILQQISTSQLFIVTTKMNGKIDKFDYISQFK